MITSVLHVAPHFGGGVGTVVRSLIEGQYESGFKHRLLAFETLDKVMLDWLGAKGLDCLQNAMTEKDLLVEWLQAADIVHIHWWNHPLLMYWMSSGNMPPFRSILWSHVNGMHAPQNFFSELFEYPDLFVFASEYSFQSPYIPKQAGYIRLVQSQSKVKITEPMLVKVNNQFNIGYIGTVDPVKMHRKFLDLCVNANIDDAKFIVCGGPQHDLLQRQVDCLGLTAMFDIRGVVSDVDAVLGELDVFGYPLNFEHYGTGEQVLLEAMGAGVVPVVLDTGCEKYIIDHGKNGLITSTLDDYSAALNYLRLNPDEHQCLSAGAIAKTRKLMQQQCGNVWLGLYEELLRFKKHEHQLKLVPELESFSEGMRLLMQSYGREPVKEQLWDLLNSIDINVDELPVGVFSATRGSPYHYSRFSPDDLMLQAMCDRLGAVSCHSNGE